MKKATELEVMKKLACVCRCEEFCCISSKLLQPTSCSWRATETTCPLTQPALPFLSSWTELFLFLLFNLLRFQLHACCFSPTFTKDFLKGLSQKVAPSSHPLPWLSGSNSLISLVSPCSVFPSFNQDVESRHFSVCPEP